MRSMRQLFLVLFLLLGLVAPTQASAATTPVGHVFIVMLENENASTTFGPDSPAPYLSKTLRNRGVFIPKYYGITHESLGNYIGLVSGQGSNPQTQADCQVYNDFQLAGMGADGQALGQGCVYPATIRTVANQLLAHGFTWKGYMEDMGNDPARESATCGHPAIGSPDPTQTASPTDQYAARHNPFVYFHSIIDKPVCNYRDVPLSRLPDDLANGRAANLSFITPDLCHDGHDATCADGGPGGLPAADAFLRDWVPQITKSQAYKQDGLLLITFDEAEGEGATADASACCHEAQFPNTPNNGGPVQGKGGGRVGAVALSPFIAPGTMTTHAYNHFSTLRTIEGLFGLPFLGYANTPNPGSFGADVFNAP